MSPSLFINPFLFSDTIKFELIMELQNQEKDSFDTQRAVENICFNLGVPYYRPMAVVEGVCPLPAVAFNPTVSG